MISRPTSAGPDDPSALSPGLSHPGKVRLTSTRGCRESYGEWCSRPRGWGLTHRSSYVVGKVSVGSAKLLGVIAFEDLPAGRQFDLGRVLVDREEMLAFNRRFDPQPFHLDEEAAKESLLGGLCASGWFTASLWMRCYVDTVLASSTSLGSPGGDEIAWPAPVFPGDELAAALVGTMTRGEQPVFRSRFTGMFGLRDPQEAS